MISSIVMFILGMLYATMLYELDREMRRMNEISKVKKQEGYKATDTGSVAGVVRTKKSDKQRR